MILDKELEITTATALDLGVVRPGPGEPIKCVALGVTATVTVTTGDTSAAADALDVITCGGEDVVEFELPSNVKQWVMFTFADGAVYIDLAGNQTNT